MSVETSGLTSHHPNVPTASGAQGRTRTGTDFSTRPSNVRVYQFRHLGWRFKEPRIGKLLLGRSCGSGLSSAGHHGAARTDLQDCQRHRRDYERDEESRCELVKERVRAARAERCLGAAATKCAREIRALALLHEHDEDEEQADDDV